MKAVAQHGFAMVEIVAALAVASLAIGLVLSSAGDRIEREKTHAQQAESRYVASLAARAHRRGLLTGDSADADDLQKALPHITVPAQVGDGKSYRIDLEGSEPRIRVDGEAEAVRAPLSAAELRIPLWRARQLRNSGGGDS